MELTNKNSNAPLPFTLADLKQMATPSSFKKGEDLFLSEEVRKITKKGNCFDAKVYGSRIYKVYLEVHEDRLDLNCNCPYDHGGICKHLVAFALKIAKGDYHEKAHKGTSLVHTDIDFEKIYSDAETNIKLQFLKQLLDRDKDFKQQFIAFTESEVKELDRIVGENVEEVRAEIHFQLSNLDLDNLDYNYDDYEYGGYRESWEVEQEAANEAIEFELKHYIDEINTYLRKGNLLDAIRIVLGIYEGIQNLPELDNENCVFSGEYNNEVQAIVNQFFRDVYNTIQTIVKSDKAIIETLNLTFERIRLCADEEIASETKITYNIKDFEALFESLTINAEIAHYLHQKIIDNKLNSFHSAHILLNLATVSSNEELWLKTAEIFSTVDANIAKQLLEKYHANHETSNFNRVAKMAFESWPNDFDKYLIDHLDSEQQENLFVSALKSYVLKNKDISYYKKLKAYMSKEETIVFVDKFKNSSYVYFYVQLLEVEERFEEILTCVYKNKSYSRIEKLIQPILDFYPEDCFKIIVELNTEALNAYKRNRHTYQTMVKTLNLLKEIPSKKTESRLFLMKLYKHKPNLPALKEEMRNAGLI